MKSETKTCQNCKKEFVIESEDFNFYEKIKVPPPTFCYICRAERRFVWRNEKRLFKVKSFFNGEEIFSLYPPESRRRVVSQKDWSSDKWDATGYARELDFSKDFFTQFFDFVDKVPIHNLNHKMMVNSSYCANAYGLKNCYLCFNSNDSEDCLYGTSTNNSKNCIDTTFIDKSEKCYESFWLENCYQCYFSILCKESFNLYFCRGCVGCSNCFGCMDLRKSSFCIFNKKYSKEEYFTEIEKMKLNTISGISAAREKARAFWLCNPVKNHQGVKNKNSTGSYVTNCNNVKDSYLMRESENMRYCQNMLAPGNKDCYDTTIWGGNMIQHYETCIGGRNSFNVKFVFDCWSGCRDVEYSIGLVNCTNCFACCGLKNKQYYILNKKYSREEYERLVEKIKKHMNDLPYVDKGGRVYKYGEYFPIEFSPFGYNNTIAAQHFEMTKEKALKNGYPWIEVEKGNYNITIKAKDLRDHIKDVDKGILKEIISCQNCKGAYRILEKELSFYKSENLPVPALCDECRFQRRIKDRLKVHLYDRDCMCGGKKDITLKYENTVEHAHGGNPCRETFKTGYDPMGHEIVYCEECYNKEVY